MNADVLLVLKKAGWHRERAINLGRLRSGLEEYEGEFPLLDLTADFYKEFGELTIKFFNPQSQQEDIWETDFAKATEFLFPGDVREEYLPRVSCQYLIPFGYWTDASRILFIDESGKVYLGADAYLALLGNTFEDALEATVIGRKPLTIYA